MIVTSTRRQKKRESIDNIVLVKDAMSGSELGHLVNISRDGFMLVGQNDLKEERLYQLELHSEELFVEHNPLVVGAECLWVKQQNDISLQWAGFQIIDISPEAVEVVSLIAT